MAEKKKAKKEIAKPKPKASNQKSYNITKSNGNVIKRDNLSDVLAKRYEAKGWKVEEA